MLHMLWIGAWFLHTDLMPARQVGQQMSSHPKTSHRPLSCHPACQFHHLWGYDLFYFCLRNEALEFALCHTPATLSQSFPQQEEPANAQPHLLLKVGRGGCRTSRPTKATFEREKAIWERRDREAWQLLLTFIVLFMIGVYLIWP